MAVLTRELSIERLAVAIEDAAEQATLLPVSRYIGAGYRVQSDMVYAIPVPLWETIERELTALNAWREET